LESREINSNDEQVQSCVEDYLEVITSVLSEKREHITYVDKYLCIFPHPNGGSPWNSSVKLDWTSIYAWPL